MSGKGESFEDRLCHNGYIGGDGVKPDGVLMIA